MSGDQGTTQSTAEEAREPRIGGLSYAPLFRIDPGWPFVIAGLALIVSAVLIPAQRELHDLEQQLKVHRAYEEKAKAELLAYEQFIADVHKGDPRLLERLVRAQLNKMPKDERPLLLMPTANDTVPQWIESSVTVDIPEPQPYADTLLARIASGPRRLWVLASGTFLVFMGILFVPSTGARRPVRRAMPVPADTVPMAAIAVATPGSASDLAAEFASELESDGSTVAESVADSIECERASAPAAELEPVPSADTADAFLTEESPAYCPVLEEVPSESAEAVSSAVPADPADQDSVQSVFEEPITVVDENCVEEGAMVEPETLDSAVAEVETFAAQDVHELQYGVVEQVDEIHAATDSLPGEVEMEVDSEAQAEADGDADASTCVIETFSIAAPSVPAATDRALDGMSLFSGIDDARWIDTRDPRG